MVCLFIRLVALDCTSPFWNIQTRLNLFPTAPLPQNNSHLGPNHPTTNQKITLIKNLSSKPKFADFPLHLNKMVPPPTKKQKIESLPKSPIIFQSPGLKPDVSLKVFDVEFYVHSIVLKLHSAFFRKFLYSANKAASRSTNSAANFDASGSASDGTTPPEASATRPSMVFGAFKYKWVTKIDECEEDKWHLVSDNPNVSKILLMFS
jgi:hypothetical protein